MAGVAWEEVPSTVQIRTEKLYQRLQLWRFLIVSSHPPQLRGGAGGDSLSDALRRRLRARGRRDIAAPLSRRVFGSRRSIAGPLAAAGARSPSPALDARRRGSKPAERGFAQGDTLSPGGPTLRHRGGRPGGRNPQTLCVRVVRPRGSEPGSRPTPRHPTSQSRRPDPRRRPLFSPRHPISQEPTGHLTRADARGSSPPRPAPSVKASSVPDKCRFNHTVSFMSWLGKAAVGTSTKVPAVHRQVARGSERRPSARPRKCRQSAARSPVARKGGRRHVEDPCRQSTALGLVWSTARVVPGLPLGHTRGPTLQARPACEAALIRHRHLIRASGPAPGDATP